MDNTELILRELDAIKREQKTQGEKIDCLEKKISRYKGFLGGVTFVLSCIAAFFSMVFKFKSGAG